MMYVAGQPGTGKTAVVSNIVASLEDWTTAIVNCVGVGNVWEAVARKLELELPAKGATTRDHVVKSLKQRKGTKLYVNHYSPTCLFFSFIKKVFLAI